MGASNPTPEEQRDALLRAYVSLSNRLEKFGTPGWSTDGALRGLAKAGIDTAAAGTYLPASTSQSFALAYLDHNNEALRPLPHPRTSRPGTHVRIGIASMPGREEQLESTLASLSPQADEIFIYLNEMSQIPENITPRHNTFFFTGPDLGDRAKFAFLPGYEGFYLTCDDDIRYAPYHAQHIVSGIERYERAAVVGWHGSRFKQNFEDYYSNSSRTIYSFRREIADDVPVHILGTGVCGFHTDTIRPHLTDFDTPNIADVYFAILCQQHSIPMVVLAHPANAAEALDTSASISAASLNHDEPEENSSEKLELNRRALATELVKHHEPWRLNVRRPIFIRPRYKVSVIGRTDPERWPRKGGIFLSCHRTKTMLEEYGWDVNMTDFSTGNPITLDGFEPDVVMMYMADPNRLDFDEVCKVIEHHASLGRPVIANLSDDNRPDRIAEIARLMTDWTARFGGLIKMMVFTRAAKERPEYHGFAENVVVIPKTLEFSEVNTATFDSTSGIFVGEIAKFTKPEITAVNYWEWIEAVREVLPGVKVYGIRQWKPTLPKPLDLDEIWLDEGPAALNARMSTIRLMLGTTKFATYEMVPLEAAAHGIPVIHRKMPQSLSSVFGTGAIEVETIDELKEILPQIYNDPMVWNSFSRAALHSALSVDNSSAGGFMHLELLRVIHLTRKAGSHDS